MKCVILCAGYATRMYPLTLDRPKALLPVKGKPLLNYLIEKLENLEEVDEIFIVTNDKFYNSFLEWERNISASKKIKILNDGTFSNEDRLGGIGDLGFVLDKENIDDDLIVLAGDNLFECDLRKIVEFFKEKNANVVGLYDVRSLDEAKRFGILEIDFENKIISFEEKPENPKATLISTGIYLYSREELEMIREYLKTGLSKEGPGYLIPYFFKSKDIYGYVIDGEWHDIGSRETYESVR